MTATIIELGISIIGNLIVGYNEREMQRIEIERYESEARAELERMQIVSVIERQNSEHNVKLLEKVLLLMTDIVKTDLELSIIQQRVNDLRLVDLGNWLTIKKKEFCDMNNDQIKQLKSHLKSADDLNEIDKIEFKKLVFETINRNLDSIKDNDKILVENVQQKLSENGVAVNSLKEEFRQFASLSIQKLLALKEQNERK